MRAVRAISARCGPHRGVHKLGSRLAAETDGDVDHPAGFGRLRTPDELEMAQQMAAHESSRTTGLYDRRNDEVALDEVERIGIYQVARTGFNFADLSRAVQGCIY